MPAFWRKHVKSRQATPIIVMLSCLVISFVTCLFHSDDCFLSSLNEGKTSATTSSGHCLACIFTTGFKSIEAEYVLPLFSVKSPVACQPIRHFIISNNYEWSYSIFLRAPPLTLTS
jgi:hypothetical protein